MSASLPVPTSHTRERRTPSALSLPPAGATSRRWRPRPQQHLYSPGGCGCALLLAPVMALGIGLAALSLGLAVLALILLVIAVALTVREIRRARTAGGPRTGFIVAATALYLLSIPYLGLFIWFWFMD